MNISEKYHTNYSSMLLAIIREHFDALYHQGSFINMLEIQKKDLDDIFSGKKDFSTDQLLKILSSHSIDQYGNYLNQNNYLFTLLFNSHQISLYRYYFHYGKVDKSNDEIFMRYYSFFNNKESISFLKENNLYHFISSGWIFSTFFRYCTNDDFKAAFDERNEKHMLNILMPKPISPPNF